jgi:hypothetical protein
MSEKNADDHLNSGAGPQPSYRPLYRAEPRQKVLHYPGTHYQLFPAVLNTRVNWQPAERRCWPNRAVRQILWLLGLVGACVLSFRVLSPDMTSDYRAPPAPGPASQAVFAATLDDSSNPLEDTPTSSSSALNQTTAPALLARAPFNIPEEPAELAVMPVKTAANAPDKPAAVVPLPAKMALNIPDLPAAPAAQPVASAGAGDAVDKAKPAQAVSAYGLPAAASAPTACSEALRAMQLCGM